MKHKAPRWRDFLTRHLINVLLVVGREVATAPRHHDSSR